MLLVKFNEFALVIAPLANTFPVMLAFPATLKFLFNDILSVVNVLLVLSNVKLATPLTSVLSLNNTYVLLPGAVILPDILPIKYGPYTFPLKLAVLPESSEFTVRLLVTVLPLILALPVTDNVPTLALPVVLIVFEPAAIVPIILPPVILPVPVTEPLPKPKLPTLALPVVLIVFEPAAIVPIIFPPVILPVPVICPEPKPKLPTLALPVVLIVFEPAEIAPIKLPAVMLPVPVICPEPKPKLPTLALPVVLIVFDPAAIVPIMLPPVILPVPVI